jgi:uncharacterized protein (DUF983 family)
METTTTTTTPKPTYKCRCGLTTHGIARSAEDKCPRCYTFSLNHEYSGSYGRCITCDTRMGSHR